MIIKQLIPMKTMQKILFVFVFVFASTLAWAQNSNVRKAEAAKEKGDLAEAMQLIEEATKHDKTKDDPKTWYTKATIHEAMLVGPDGEILDISQLDKTVEAYKKAKEVSGGSGTYAVFSDQRIEAIWGQFLNTGAEAYQNQEFEAALESFETAAKLMPEDTTAYLYAGISAQQAEIWDKAAQNYYKLMDLGYEQKDIYNSVIYIERAINSDNEKALEVVRRGRAVFPDDKDLMKEEINLLIVTDQAEEARIKLENAIQSEPDNANLYYNLAFLYDQIDETDKAIESYKKAVELEPNYFDANFNLAVVYYNKAADLIKKSNDMDLKTYQKEGKKLEETAKEDFRRSLPYFEKAHEINPQDLTVLETLQTVYSQLRMNDKVAELSKKIEALN